MRKRLRKKKSKQCGHPIDIMLDITKGVARRQRLKVDVESFQRAKGVIMKGCSIPFTCMGVA